MVKLSSARFWYTSSHLEHPNTIRIYDFGQTYEGRFFYVMERLDGIDLDSLVKRFGPVPWRRPLPSWRSARSARHWGRKISGWG